MTRVLIHPGACGMQATVEVVKKAEKIFAVKITSECEMAVKLGKEIPELTLMDAFKRFLDNPVYRAGTICLKHVACPVPSGILKALEVEAGLNLPRDVSITFLKNKSASEE
ncbi:MAG: hypothetical protein ABSA46_01010 [Thermodesulfovibrionales bacterium]|jgi:hypothetical protein